MKKYLFLCLLIGLAFSNSVFAEAEDTSTPFATKSKVDAKEELEKDAKTNTSLVPDSVPMSLDFTKSDSIMPAGFRGGDPDSGLVEVLEDVFYEKHEHCLIYEEDAKKMTDDEKAAKFDSDPNITWTTQRVDKEGNNIDKNGNKEGDPDYEPVVDSVNNNVAHCGGYFYETGDYQIGNSGGRLVDTGIGNSGGDDGGEGKEGQKVYENKDAVDDTTKTVTSGQTMGVFVHDCTSPDVWIAFQEGAGTTDMAACKADLVEKITKECVKLKGRPDTTDTSRFEDFSLLCVDEGKTEDRDKAPWNKTATLSAIGPMFNADGVLKACNEVNVKSGCISKEDQTRLVPVSIDEDKNKENASAVKSVIDGIYVRRNVPFIFAATSIDNGSDRKKQMPVIPRIEDEDGKEIQASSDNSYIFRVANYPEDSYKDQPKYYFVAKARDDSGNITTIRLPLYILDSNASFETSSK